MKNLQRLADSFCSTHGLEKIPVEFKAIKRANGLYCWKGNSAENSRIVLSSGIKEHYGFAQQMSTLLHELTHYYCHVKFNDVQHSETFKKYCSMFGGTMNESMAGEEYSEAASQQYVSSAIEFRLQCSCGRCRSQRYLKLPALSYRKNRWCGSCMETMDMWQKVGCR